MKPFGKNQFLALSSITLSEEDEEEEVDSCCEVEVEHENSFKTSMGSTGLKMTSKLIQLVAAPTTKPNTGNTTKPYNK
jgi:hypothetical protein